jgi:hypothetical protein
MSAELNVPAGEHDADVSNVDEFYIYRINWLITIGRSDLIDEIADDYERRRAAPRTTADNASVVLRPPHVVHHARSSQSEPRVAAELPPKPVDTGTRLAVSRLRRSLRLAPGHMRGH